MNEDEMQDVNGGFVLHKVSLAKNWFIPIGIDITLKNVKFTDILTVGAIMFGIVAGLNVGAAIKFAATIASTLCALFVLEDNIGSWPPIDTVAFRVSGLGGITITNVKR